MPRGGTASHYEAGPRGTVILLPAMERIGLMGGKSGAEGFAEVDRAGRSEMFVSYLDTVTGVEAVQAYKRRSYDLLRIRTQHCARCRLWDG